MAPGTVKRAIKKHSQEARELIRKRQILIEIDDKTKDGWQVVANYECDDLASGYEDENQLKKAREAASRRDDRRTNSLTNAERKQEPATTADDNQLFQSW